MANPPYCWCPLETIAILEIQTESTDRQNLGRKYWRCAFNKCSFFKWADPIDLSKKREESHGSFQKYKTSLPIPIPFGGTEAQHSTKRKHKRKFKPSDSFDCYILGESPSQS